MGPWYWHWALSMWWIHFGCIQLFIFVHTSYNNKVVIFIMRIEYSSGYPSGFLKLILENHQTQYHAFICSVMNTFLLHLPLAFVLSNWSKFLCRYYY